MTCTNCGAEIGETDTACPYCGIMNYPAAEKEYHDKLERIKEDLNQLPSIPKKAYSRKALLFLIITLSLAFLSMTVVFGIITIQNYKVQKEDEEFDDYINRLQAWEDEIFPKLDTMYEKGQYEALAKYRSQLIMEENEFLFGGWEHGMFIEIYSDHFNLSSIKEEVAKGNRLELLHIEEAVASCMNLVYYLDEDRLNEYINATETILVISSEEKDLIQGYRKEAEEMLFDFLMFTEEEAITLFDKCLSNNYMSKVPCHESAKIVEKRLYPNSK